MNHFWKLHKKKKQQKQLEREKQGFVPTGFPPTPVSSPKKGAKAVCSSFTATKAYLKQTLKAEADKMNGLEPKKPRPPRCHYCLRDSHLPNNCWSVDPWRCPEWFLRKWIQNVRPTPREPSRGTIESWGEGNWAKNIQYEVLHHEFHYLVTVLEKRIELGTACETLVREDDILDTIPDNLTANPAQSKRARFARMMYQSNFTSK